METGRVIKVISNRYEVLDLSGRRNLCVAMGKLRKGMSPVVGDMVEFERFADQIGIQRILPRHNELRRPAVANVDQAVIIMSCKDPDFSSALVDRLIFLICYAGIKPVLCVTKADLIFDDDPVYEQIEDYRKSGYDVYISGKNFEQEEVKAIFADKISVLTGQSGAGKSSLINRLEPSFTLQTQEISKALGRGKHTTRHCELHPVCGGWIADTPGFSSLDFSGMDVSRLAESIPDFKEYLGMCRFRNCIHINEPDCAIQEGVRMKFISASRYAHYKEVAAMIQAEKPKY